MLLHHFDDIRSDEKQTRDQASQFVKRELQPTVTQDDIQCTFRRSLFDHLSPLRLHAATLPPEYGGLGLSHRCYYAFLEELARGSLAFSISVSVTNLTQGALIAYGNKDQKERFLKPLIEGKWLGAFSLSEPQAGSDAAALQLSARPAKGGYVLNGSKLWCTNAGHADLTLVMARTDEHKTQGISAFLLPKDTPGFRVGKMEKKLGLRSSTLAELIFDKCFIPTSQRLGDEGQGLEVALSQLDAGRIAIGTVALAAASAALEFAWPSAQQSSTAEADQHRLARHFGQMLAVRSLIEKAADYRDEGRSLGPLASAIKLIASDLSMQVCHDAVEIIGAPACQTGHPVERILRDAKALQIVEGTNQVQQLVLARAVNSLLQGTP